MIPSYSSQDHGIALIYLYLLYLLMVIIFLHTGPVHSLLHKIWTLQIFVAILNNILSPFTYYSFLLLEKKRAFALCMPTLCMATLLHSLYYICLLVLFGFLCKYSYQER